MNLIKSWLYWKKKIVEKEKISIQYYIGELVFKSVSAKVNSLRRCSSYFRFIFEQYVLFGSGYVSISCLYLFIVWRTFFFFFFCESIKSDSTLGWGIIYSKLEIYFKIYYSTDTFLTFVVEVTIILLMFDNWLSKLWFEPNSSYCNNDFLNATTFQISSIVCIDQFFEQPVFKFR